MADGGLWQLRTSRRAAMQEVDGAVELAEAAAGAMEADARRSCGHPAGLGLQHCDPGQPCNLADKVHSSPSKVESKPRPWIAQLAYARLSESLSNCIGYRTAT